MKTKQQMIQEILNKYEPFISRADLEDFSGALESQDDVSIWEVHKNNIVEGDTDEAHSV